MSGRCTTVRISTCTRPPSQIWNDPAADYYVGHNLMTSCRNFGAAVLLGGSTSVKLRPGVLLAASSLHISHRCCCPASSWPEMLPEVRSCTSSTRAAHVTAMRLPGGKARGSTGSSSSNRYASHASPCSPTQRTRFPRRTSLTSTLGSMDSTTVPVVNPLGRRPTFTTPDIYAIGTRKLGLEDNIRLGVNLLRVSTP